MQVANPAASTDEFRQATHFLVWWLVSREHGADCESSLREARGRYLRAVAGRENLSLEQAERLLERDYLYQASK